MSEAPFLTRREAILDAIHAALARELADVTVIRGVRSDSREDGPDLLLLRDGDIEEAGERAPRRAGAPLLLVAAPKIEGVVRGTEAEVARKAARLAGRVFRALWGANGAPVFTAIGPSGRFGLRSLTEPDPGETRRADRFEITLSITFEELLP